MIEIGIPDFGRLHLAHLILDYSGSLAFDRRLLSGVADLLGLLAEHLQIHIITADTFGSVHRPLPAPTLQSMSCLRAQSRICAAIGKHVIGLHRQWPQRPARTGRGRAGNCPAPTGGHNNTGAYCGGYHHSEYCRCFGSPSASEAYYRHCTRP
jgi:hypothetical protein